MGLGTIHNISHLDETYLLISFVELKRQLIEIPCQAGVIEKKINNELGLISILCIILLNLTYM